MVFEKLPSSVKPVNYDLHLKPDLKSLTFKGWEKIKLEVLEATETIVVNAREITIEEAALCSEDGGRESCAVNYDVEEEKVFFGVKSNPKSLIKPGQYTLELEYSGVLNSELRGFYRTKYSVKTASGQEEERYGAVTHFEATGARRAFPCFDEPALRATFDITLTVPTDRVALSNMPKKKESAVPEDAGLTRVEFERTPIMPTYLVAFVVGDFSRATCQDQDGVQVTVYTPKSKPQQGEFAATVARDTLPFYKDYFGVSYGLPKIDLVAAPDFPIGAMENWGLVIYRERCLLVDPLKSSSQTREYVSLIVGHELAHNWFGNLVTLNWWTHLWLKEGFASWIEYLCVDQCFPEFDVWTQFVSMDLGRALKLDALDNSHPIEVEVGDPSQIDEIFDTISYCKGASIVRMLHDYIGDEDFRKGMHAYLEKHKFGSASTEDLWAALEEASCKPIGRVMSTWTKQKGFPVLKVSEKQNGNQRVLQIEQQKFSVSGNKGDTSQWIVPVSISTQASPREPEKKILLEGTTESVTLNLPENQWLKVNTGSTGVYRVQYSPDMLSRLIPSIQDRSLPPTDRLGIISDLFALCYAGLTTSSELLAVVRAFSGEDNYTVWSDLLSNMAELSRKLQGSGDASSVSELYREFVCGLLLPVYADLGWEPSGVDEEDHLALRLRELVTGMLGVYGDGSVKQKAFAAFEDLVSGKKGLSSDMRRTVFRTVMRHGSRKEFETLKQMYIQSDSQEEKSVIGNALGCAKDLDVIKEVLQFAISAAVREQDSPAILSSVSGSSYQGRQEAWAFFKDNYQELSKRYSSSTLMASLVKFTTEDFVKESEALEVEEFFRLHPTPAAERTVQQSCEKIRLSAGWLQREQDNLWQYLTENPVKSTHPLSSGQGDSEKGKLSEKGQGPSAKKKARKARGTDVEFIE